MDIPIKAQVECSDGPCGQSTLIIINPITQQVTHLVIKEKRFPHAERLVQLDQIVETTLNWIRLRCTSSELHGLDIFNEIEFCEMEIPTDASFPFLMNPYIISENLLVPMDHERIPPGELAVHRGALVEASDGCVGQLNEFLVDPVDGHITHLVLRKGHLWGKKDVTIPVSEIERFEEGVVYLKLNKQAIEQLPSMSVWRRYIWYEAPKPGMIKQDDEFTTDQTPATIDIIIANLSDPDRWVRQDARWSLVDIGKPAVAPLVAALAQSNHQLRWEATKTLGQIGDPRAAETLVNALEDGEFDIRWLAAEGLVAIGCEGLPLLLQALIERPDSVRLRESAHHVLRSLEVICQGNMLRSVLTALESAEPAVATPIAAYTTLENLEGGASTL